MNPSFPILFLLTPSKLLKFIFFIFSNPVRLAISYLAPFQVILTLTKDSSYNWESGRTSQRVITPTSESGFKSSVNDVIPAVNRNGHILSMQFGPKSEEIVLNYR